MKPEHKVIVAAVAATVGGRAARITRIREVPDSAWARNGRAAIQASHGVAPPLVRMVRDWRPGKK